MYMLVDGFFVCLFVVVFFVCFFVFLLLACWLVGFLLLFIVCGVGFFVGFFVVVLLLFCCCCCCYWGAGRSSDGAMGRRIDPSWGGLIELFPVPASAPQLV